MGFIIGLLTVIMALDCLFLVLLVLMQLPKKEAGAGLAFGGAATDALFGAGSGNFLTKATKYAAIVFFILTVALSVMQNMYFHRSSSDFRRQMERQSQQTPVPPVAPAGTPATSGTAPDPATQSGSTTVTGSNLLLQIESAPATNSAPATAP